MQPFKLLVSSHSRYIEFKVTHYLYKVNHNNSNVIGEIKENESSNICGIAKTFYSDSESIISYYKNDSTYFLRDLTKGDGIITLHGDKNENEDYVSGSPNWNLKGMDQYALDAHYGISQTYLFYKTLFNRNSIDDNGYAIYSYVNDPGVPNNAIWDGKVMKFGIQTSTGRGITSLDIIGHELTHAITSNTSHLHSGGESGAISESISDIMGKSIEFWSNPKGTSWVISSSMSYSVRDMSNPISFHQPDTYKDSIYWYRGSSDDKNDHINSGVGNYMFYLLVKGGKGANSKGRNYNIKGIGLGAADSIIYRTETHYLKSNSQYCDWREGCIKAAADMYGLGSKQAKSTQDAWNAVGVPTCQELYKQ
jgi:bacillolysin